MTEVLGTSGGARHRLSDPASVVFAPVIEILGDIGLPEGSRNVVEKTFGEDLESARELNPLLHEASLRKPCSRQTT